MSGFNPYGNNPPQYPPPQQNQVFPPLYASAPSATGQQCYPGLYPTQSGGYWPSQPGQPNQTGPQQPGHPAAMSYPGMQPSPAGQPPAYGFPGYPTVTPQYGGSPVEWIPTTVDNASTLSDRAVVAGYEGHDHSPLWVIRARYEGDLIPGKLAIKHRSAYVPWGGNENAVHSIEVCCAHPERIRWQEARDGNVPPNAVIGGNTASGEPLYVGRAKEQGSLTPGKIHRSHGSMYISFAGKEVPHKVYEVLCTV